MKPFTWSFTIFSSYFILIFLLSVSWHSAQLHLILALLKTVLYLVSNSNCSSLLCRKTNDFHILIFYPMSLVHLFFIQGHFFFIVDLLTFSAWTTVPFVNFYFFLISIHEFLYFCHFKNNI